jgi:hypothetical protein
MFLSNDPGPWQYYVNRQDNVGLSIMEVKDKYMREQLLFEQQMNFIYQQQMIMSQVSSGGGPLPLNDTTNDYVEDDYVENYFI